MVRTSRKNAELTKTQIVLLNKLRTMASELKSPFMCQDVLGVKPTTLKILLEKGYLITRQSMGHRFFKYTGKPYSEDILEDPFSEYDAQK